MVNFITIIDVIIYSEYPVVIIFSEDQTTDLTFSVKTPEDLTFSISRYQIRSDEDKQADIALYIRNYIYPFLRQTSYLEAPYCLTICNNFM